MAVASAIMSGIKTVSCGNLVSPQPASSNRVVGVGPIFRHRNVKLLRVRSMADEGGETQDVAGKGEALPQPTPTPTPPPQKPSSNNSLWDVLAFSGPGPERINGRLAMIGFVAAMGVEVAKGQDIFSQIQDGGLPWFLGTSVVLSLASLVPMIRGVTAESKSGDLMTSDAEIWNGRFAMLGLVALAFTEYLKGGALV